jgi:hypothetical protein
MKSVFLKFCNNSALTGKSVLLFSNPIKSKIPPKNFSIENVRLFSTNLNLSSSTNWTYPTISGVLPCGIQYSQKISTKGLLDSLTNSNGVKNNTETRTKHSSSKNFSSNTKSWSKLIVIIGLNSNQQRRMFSSLRNSPILANEHSNPNANTFVMETISRRPDWMMWLIIGINVGKFLFFFFFLHSDDVFIFF